MTELFDGRLDNFGVYEKVVEGESSSTNRLLTDGRNYVWVTGEGNVIYLSRFGMNAPGKILSAVEEAFNTEIVSEYEPQFWGFNTQEEWDAEMEKMAEESRNKFYQETVKYVQGESNDIRSGTVGMTQAEIAKKLVSEDPGLLSIERKDELMDAIDKIYEDEHVIKIELSHEDMEFARMIATHEDDLPF